MSFDSLGGADALVLPEVSVAVVSAEPGQMEKFGVATATNSGVMAIEPECFAYAFATAALGPSDEDETGASRVGSAIDLSPAAASYLRGYRDALTHLTDSLLGAGSASAEAAALQPAAALDETAFTWGLQATRAQLASYGERNPRCGPRHRIRPEPSGFPFSRKGHVVVCSRSDCTGWAWPRHALHGHGLRAESTRRPTAYGLRTDASMFIGKVLSNQGSGTDGWILAGINWAIANNCAVVSMSLGRKADPGDPFPIAYEQAAQAGLARGTLIVMAAGNESDRAHGIISPVGHPASCPSIMAVGAIDSMFRIANFSNRSIESNGGDVDIAGPGVAVRSSWPMPQRYNTISGTSMATPHVAGIAALFAQSSSSLRGVTLWKKLTANARNILTIPLADDGAGPYKPHRVVERRYEMGRQQFTITVHPEAIRSPLQANYARTACTSIKSCMRSGPSPHLPIRSMSIPSAK